MTAFDSQFGMEAEGELFLGASGLQRDGKQPGLTLPRAAHGHCSPRTILHLTRVVQRCQMCTRSCQCPSVIGRSAGRVLQTAIFNNPTFKWAMVGLGGAIALAAIALFIWAIVTKCGRAKSSPVSPNTVSQEDHQPTLCDDTCTLHHAWRAWRNSNGLTSVLAGSGCGLRSHAFGAGRVVQGACGPAHLPAVRARWSLQGDVEKGGAHVSAAKGVDGAPATQSVTAPALQAMGECACMARHARACQQ
jgi:hypothetical protein